MRIQLSSWAAYILSGEARLWNPDKALRRSIERTTDEDRQIGHRPLALDDPQRNCVTRHVVESATYHDGAFSYSVTSKADDQSTHFRSESLCAIAEVRKFEPCSSDGLLKLLKSVG